MVYLQTKEIIMNNRKDFMRRNKKDKRIGIVVFICGVILITLVSQILFSQFLSAVTEMQEPSAESYRMQTVSTTINYIYPVLNDLTLVMGIGLLILSIPVYRGNLFGKTLALGGLAVISIIGAFIIETAPYISNQLIQNGILILLFGLLSSLIILLNLYSSEKYKLLKIVLFIMIIISAGGNLFGTYEAFLEMQTLLSIPEEINLNNFTGMYSNFFGVILTAVGIPYLAAFTKKGFWIISFALLIMSISSLNIWINDFSHPHMILYLPVAILPAITLAILIFLKRKGSYS